MDRDRGVDSPSGKFDNTSCLSVYQSLPPCISHSPDFHILLVVSTKRDLMSLRLIFSFLFFFFTVYCLFLILGYFVASEMEHNMYS